MSLRGLELWPGAEKRLRLEAVADLRDQPRWGRKPVRSRGGALGSFVIAREASLLLCARR